MLLSAEWAVLCCRTSVGQVNYPKVLDEDSGDALSPEQPASQESQSSVPSPGEHKMLEMSSPGQASPALPSSMLQVRCRHEYRSQVVLHVDVLNNHPATADWFYLSNRLNKLQSKLLQIVVMLLLSDLGLSNCSTRHKSDLYQRPLCVSAICYSYHHSIFKTRPNSGESRSFAFHL